MQEVFFSGTPLLESVGKLEPEMVSLRETIRRAITKSFIPVTAYAKKFEHYLEIVNLDIKAYVK